MKDWKNICRRLLYPPVWADILLAVISAAALIYIFLSGLEKHPAAYAVYILSFYALSVIVLACIRVFPGYYKNAKQRVYDHPVGGRYVSDPEFRTHISLYRSLGVNILYAAANIVSGFIYHSAWFVILAGYYTILAVMRFLLLRFVKRTGLRTDQLRELRRSRQCAAVLLTVNLALTGAVLMMLYQNKGYEYHGILIYVMASYTFYITINAVVNIIRSRKYNSPVMSAAKFINLTAALVSMLSLETAMISQFGSENSPQFRRIMIAATGGGVSAVVITISIYMIVTSTRAINNLKKKH